MSEERFTLAEAKAEIAREQCRKGGHAWDFDALRLLDEAPTGIHCAVCCWRGAVTMGEKP